MNTTTPAELATLRDELAAARRQLDAVKTWAGAHLPCGVCCSHAQASVRRVLADPTSSTKEV
ncbi:hypothetical protein [Kitasatospora sp. NPDC004289]